MFGMQLGVTLDDKAVSEIYRDEILQDALRSLVYDYSTDKQVACLGTGTEPEASFYQWTIESNDGLATIYTNHVVCRYDDLAEGAPSCPWNACLDA